MAKDGEKMTNIRTGRQKSETLAVLSFSLVEATRNYLNIITSLDIELVVLYFFWKYLNIFVTVGICAIVQRYQGIDQRTIITKRVPRYPPRLGLDGVT